jgi:hypothetical protein
MEWLEERKGERDRKVEGEAEAKAKAEGENPGVALWVS